MTTDNNALSDYLVESLKREEETRAKNFKVSGNMASIIGCQTSLIDMLKGALKDALEFEGIPESVASTVRFQLSFVERNQKMCDYVWENRDSVDYSDVSREWKQISESLGK